MLEAGVLNSSNKHSYKNNVLVTASFLLFLLLLPISLKIDFFQNDDWVYYLNVQWFLNGNLSLHPYIGPTFYMQGLAGAIFSKLLDISRLPLLTLLLSVVSFYLVSLICTRFLRKTLTESMLFGLLFFVTPINVYLIWGFMTEHYFLPILLVSIYLFLLYEESGNSKYLYLCFFTAFIGLLTRQVALMLPLGISIYLLLKSKYRHSIISFLTFLAFYLFLNKIFPLTAVMKEEPLRFHHLLNFDYSYALSYGVLLVLTAFLMPLFLSIFKIKELSEKKVKLLLFVMFLSFLYFLLNFLFKPETISWGEFPYFENTVERTGFYPRGVHGTKYQFRGNYDLYKYWDLGAKVLLSSFISYAVIYKKLRVNIFLVLSIVYLGLINLTETFYDRYIFMLIPLTIFYIASISTSLNRLNIFLFVGFILIVSLLMYQFSMDFVLVNKYIWNRSTQLIYSENIEPKYIHGTNAWKLNYRNEGRAYKYLFSYDSPKVNTDLASLYTLIETYEVNYPLNIFINSKIYLYKLN